MCWTGLLVLCPWAGFGSFLGENKTPGFSVPGLTCLRGDCSNPVSGCQDRTQSKGPPSVELARSSAGERYREELPWQGHQCGERRPSLSGGAGKGTSPGTSASPYQSPGAWEPWSPTASTRSYFPFLPYTHPLVASFLCPARMKLEAALGWAGGQEPSPITDEHHGHQIVLGGRTEMGC